MTLKPRRRYQPRAPYAYCTEGDWDDSEAGSPASRVIVAEAEVHHLATGHPVVVEWQQRLIIGTEPEPRPARSCTHDREDAPAGVIGCCARGAA